MQHQGSMCLTELWSKEQRTDYVVKNRHNNQGKKNRIVIEEKYDDGVYRPDKIKEKKKVKQKLEEEKNSR